MRMPRADRRRGSVLVLVMTLLGVLFVMGVAFLASMNFEADLIDAQRVHVRNRVGAEGVIDDLSAVLRDGLIAGPGFPFGTAAVGQSITSFADLPGVHNLGAPLEPRQTNVGGPRRFVFDWITDLRAIKDANTATQPDGSMFRQLFEFQDFAKGVDFAGIDTNWPPGVPVFLDGNPAALTIDINGDNLNDSVLPVDADGDGISDTLAFPLADLGFSDTQIAALSAQLNPPTNREGNVYLGLRVIPHGGMVNLNESHPLLIANVLGVGASDLRNTPQQNINFGYLNHRPSKDCDLASCTKYAPASEEPLLRRRYLLPPKDIPPSLLHGTPVLVATGSPAAGGADLAWMLYPPSDGGEYETVFANAHGYTPFDPLADDDANCNAPIWAARMDPFVTQFAAGTCNPDEYDRRHLVTTVSHDDLLSRGATWVDGTGQEHAMLDLMRKANREADGTVCPAVLPFEYADYPPSIPNGTIPNINGSFCNCPTKGVCRFDPRKGRLQLSLATLDDQFPCASLSLADGYQNCVDRRNRLIYDVFLMLLSNARGPYWDDVDCSPLPVGTGGVCPGNEQCMLLGTGISGKPLQLCTEPPTGRRRSEALKSRTAASLTANLIDYMDLECRGGTKDGMECRIDADCGGGTCMDRGLPTRIAIRSLDINDRTCVNNGIGTGAVCNTNADCGGGEKCLSTFGWEFGSDRISTIPKQYVYGLEKQPYITEVATVANATVVTAQAVEVFNPYGTEFPGLAQQDEYLLVEVDPTVGLGSKKETRIKNNLKGQAFTVFVDPQASFAPIPPSAVVVDNGVQLNFENSWIVYLVHRLRYPGDAKATDIIVDQFTVGNELMNIGKLEGFVNGPDSDTPPNGFDFTLERVVRGPNTQWTAPVPRAFEGPEGADNHSLGTWNGTVDQGIRPVEVQFANTGSFTKLHPFNDPVSDSYNPGEPPRGIAFPTTGSMLLAMRHANRSLDDYTGTSDLAFTTWLDRLTQVPDPENALAQPLDILERVQVDNGRMPVFDPPAKFCVGPGFVGMRCNDDANCAGLICQAIGAAHHAMPKATAQNTPGGKETLPWGQLVFDYFTALPLSNPGPYENIDNTSKPEAKPRVDVDGLRVHGRININAAPWKVLAGLPLVPMNNVPSAFRSKIRWGAGFVDPAAGDYLNPDPDTELFVKDNVVSPIGQSLAQAIVAYRELREIDDFDGTGPVTTGDFGTDLVNGRGWMLDTPAARRGSGFVSVGELANVRHADASAFPSMSGGTYSYRRTDFGEIGQPDADFVEAVGLLVALGDWVTVRSHVFTVYGTLRGDWDMEEYDNPTIDDYKNETPEVTSRALRFQETIDRLPTFLGAPEPVRIGQRVVRKFTDVNND
jgi:hypothetical protein